MPQGYGPGHQGRIWPPKGTRMGMNIHWHASPPLSGRMKEDLRNQEDSLYQSEPEAICHWRWEHSHCPVSRGQQGCFLKNNWHRTDSYQGREREREQDLKSSRSKFESWLCHLLAGWGAVSNPGSLNLCCLLYGEKILRRIKLYHVFTVPDT